MKKRRGSGAGVKVIMENGSSLKFLKRLRRKQKVKKILQSILIPLLFVACGLLAIKLYTDADAVNTKMKSCQRLWSQAGYTIDEAKDECKL